MKTEPTICEKFADNGEHSHWELINTDTGETLWKEGQSSTKIKQLEWKEYENYRGRKSYFAKTPFSPYEVAEGGDHYIMFSPDKRLRFTSANEAKAAAQADFEKRIKECLE